MPYIEYTGRNSDDTREMRQIKDFGLPFVGIMFSFMFLIALPLAIAGQPPQPKPSTTTDLPPTPPGLIVPSGGSYGQDLGGGVFEIQPGTDPFSNISIPQAEGVVYPPPPTLQIQPQQVRQQPQEQVVVQGYADPNGVTQKAIDRCASKAGRGSYFMTEKPSIVEATRPARCDQRRNGIKLYECSTVYGNNGQKLTCVVTR